MRIRGTLALRAIAIVGACAVSASACGSDGADVTIYSGRGERLIQPILDEFEEASGLSVEVKYGKSADLALLIEEEAAAGGSKADVFLSQSPGSIGFLEQNDRLAELPAATLALVPPSVSDDGGKWVGFSGRQRVLVYNTDQVDPADLPSSVFALTDPEWSGRVGVAPSNGSFQDFVTAMRVTEGDEITAKWLADLNANDPKIYANNNAIVQAVGRGEVESGLVNHYYNYRALAENPNQPSANHNFEPDDPGSLLIVTGAAILATAEADEFAAGTQLINFLLSSAGQQYFATETFEYPLAAGEEPAGDVPPIDFADVGGIAYELLGGGLEQTRELIIDAGFDG
jgi:iron(III) transport system substrate-binding protein